MKNLEAGWLIKHYDKQTLAEALVGAFAIIGTLQCPDCGHSLEVSVESTSQKGREQGSGGTDKVER